jgi:hypothetical protein
MFPKAVLVALASVQTSTHATLVATELRGVVG